MRQDVSLKDAALTLLNRPLTGNPFKLIAKLNFRKEARGDACPPRQAEITFVELLQHAHFVAQNGVPQTN